MKKSNDALTTFLAALMIFLVIFILKFIDFIFIKSNQGMIGVNYIYVSFCLTVLFVLTKTMKNETLGYPIEHSMFFIKGSLFYIPFYFAGMGAETVYLYLMKYHPKLYIKNEIFNFTGQNMTASPYSQAILILIFIFISIVMEEGLFRGILLQNLKRDFSLRFSMITVAFLYAIWKIMPHIALLIGSEFPPRGIYINILLTIILSLAASIKYSLEKELTGNLWFPTGDHFMSLLLFTYLKVNVEVPGDISQHVRFIMIKVTAIIFLLFIRKKGNKIKFFKNYFKLSE